MVKKLSDEEELGLMPVNQPSISKQSSSDIEELGLIPTDEKELGLMPVKETPLNATPEVIKTKLAEKLAYPGGKSDIPMEQLYTPIKDLIPERIKSELEKKVEAFKNIQTPQFEVAGSNAPYTPKGLQEPQAEILQPSPENQPQNKSILLNLAQMTTQEVVREGTNVFNYIIPDIGKGAVLGLTKLAEVTPKSIVGKTAEYLTKDLYEALKPILTKTDVLAKFSPENIRNIMTRKVNGKTLTPEEDALYYQINDLSKNAMKKAWEDGIIEGTVERPAYTRARETLSKIGIDLPEYREGVGIVKPEGQSGQLALPEKTGIPAESIKPEARVPEITQEHKVVGIDSDSGLPIVKMVPKTETMPIPGEIPPSEAGIAKPTETTTEPIKIPGETVPIPGTNPLERESLKYKNPEEFHNEINRVVAKGIKAEENPLYSPKLNSDELKLRDAWHEYINKPEVQAKYESNPKLMDKDILSEVYSKAHEQKTIEDNYPNLQMPELNYSDIYSEIKSKGGIRPYKPDMYGKVALKEEYNTTVPIHLRSMKGRPLDEMAQELYNDNMIPEPSETALLEALDKAKTARRNNIAAIIRESPTMEQANKAIINEVGIDIPIETLKKYEVQYKGGATPDQTNKITNDLANEIKLEEIVPRKIPVKSMIAKTTGMKQQAEIKNIREDVLLRKQIRDEARGAMEGFKEGAKITKEQMIEKFKTGQANRQTVVDYVKENLPVKEQGRFINALREVGDIKKQFSIFARVDRTKEEMERKELGKEVAELLTPKGNLAVDYQKQIKGLALDIDMKTPTDKTIYKLKALSDFIKKNGEPMGISLERLTEIDRLSKISLKKMNAEDLTKLKDNLSMLNKLGKLKLGLKNKYNERERAINLDKLLKSSNNIDPKRTGNEKIDKAKFEAKQFFFKTLHTPRVADAIDGYKLYKGENVKYVKRLGAGEIKAKTEARNKTISIIEKVKAIKPEWTEAEQRDIVMLLHYEQMAFDQVETLMQLHDIKELPKKTPEYAQVMDIIRSGLNNADRIAPIYEETTNKIFKKVDNYFPIKYEKEFNMLPEDMVNQERHRTTKAFQGFTKERVKGVQRIPRTDLFSILDDTINEQEWYINLQPELENIKYLVKDPEYKLKAGEIADDFWRNELDIVSRRGWSATAKNSFLLKQARMNLNTAVLGFRVSTLMLQPTAVFDAIALAQVDYGTKASIEIAKEFGKTWLNPWYAKKIISESPALTLREGGELGMEETFQQSKTGKLMDRFKALSMWGIKKSDVITAAAAQKGIENILTKNGIPNAKEESEFFMNMSQASSDAAYRPQILATGEFARTIFTFQTFVLNRWGIILNDIIRTGYHNPTIKKSLNALIALGALVGAQIAEQESRQFIKQELSPNSKQKPDSLLKTSLLAIPSQVPYFGSMFEAATKGYDSDPAVVRSVRDIFKGGYQTLKPGKEHPTYKENQKEMQSRVRGALTAGGSLIGLFTGLPGASQGTEILEQFTYENKK